MKIITNLDFNDNHYYVIKSRICCCNEVIIASPFLMDDFKAFFNDLDLKKLKKIHLITTLKPKSFDQIRKVTSFQSLIELPIIQNKSVKYQISIDNRLHGKIYIFKKKKKPFSAIITSANFTDSGLSTSHEWGVEITNENQITALEKSIYDCIEVDSISQRKISELNKLINIFLGKNPKSENREIPLNLSTRLKFNSKKRRFDDSTEFWLKPIGVTGFPVTPDRKFDSKTYDLHFSKQRPTGVRKNDIVICYGVGSGKILSIYQTTSLPKYSTVKQMNKTSWLKRWPWYIKSKNISPKYGSNWTRHDLKIGQLALDFLNLASKGGVLANGSKSLGGLNWGKDKLKLSPEFAKFIINKVIKRNK
ncbi:MAG: NgoFVII family restriction endonuclease [Ignavibacteriaceae bacterium]|jgi:HKD family nuclease|nr:NgoFVII family restriction endonuclease [Ignavibacteriaceae bacterium]